MKTDAQVNLFDAIVPEPSPALSRPAADNPDALGCCSMYRECSDAGECLVKDEEHCKRIPSLSRENWAGAIESSARCLYRANLEAGRIFYGKNASGFDRSEYAELCQRVDSLSPAARAAFDAVLIDFYEYHRAARYCIVRNENIAELSAVGLFEFRTLGAEFLKRCSYRSFLRPAVLNHPEYGPLFKQAQADRKLDKRSRAIPSAGSKEFMLYWLDHDGAPLRDLLADPYRLAFLRPEQALYAEAFYHDNLFSGCGGRIYPLSVFAEDGLLSPTVFEEEEARRLKVSRGYSMEEKVRRLSAVQRRHADKVPDKDNPFCGKMCVITGTLSRMERSEALFEIMQRGGRVSDTPVNSMDILILGYQEWSAMNGGIAPRKVQKAVDLQKSGKDVKILSEDEFYSMLKESSL